MSGKKRIRGPGYDEPPLGYVRQTFIVPKIPIRNLRELAALRQMTIKDAMEEAIKDWVIKKTQRGWK